MAYGKLKVDTITYDNSGTDVDVAVSALAGAGSTAGVGTANTFTGTNTFDGSFVVNSSYSTAVKTISGTSIDISTGNYFVKTVTAATTFTFDNPPVSGKAASFIVEIDLDTGGSIAWPATVKFNAGQTPSIEVGKTSLFMFVTDDAGATYRGACLANYVD